MNKKHNIFSILHDVFQEFINDIPQLENDKKIIRAGSIMDESKELKIDYLFHMGLDLDKHLLEKDNNHKTDRNVNKEHSALFIFA